MDTMQTSLEVFSRPTIRTVSLSMAEICQFGLNERLITKYTTACSMNRFKAVTDSSAETTCICSAQPWWHHPERCKSLVVRKIMATLLTSYCRLSADQRRSAIGQSSSFSSGRRTGAARTQVGARSRLISPALPFKIPIKRYSRR
jgi:hypothetical protein